MTTKQDVRYLRAFLFFFHSSAIIIISFLPLYFDDIGLTGSKIGLLLSMGPFAALIFQPLWGYLSDKYQTVKKAIIILLIGVLLTVSILFQTTNFYLLLPFMVLYYSFFSPIGALGDSLAQRTAIQLGISFGSIRTWGSIGFATTGIVGGYTLSVIGITNILYPYLFYTILSLVIVMKIADVKEESKPIRLTDTKKVLKVKKFVLFIFFMLFITITHRTNDTYLGIFISSRGGDETLVGWAWFVAVSSEAIMFATSRYWLRWFHEITLIIIASMLYTVRWFLFSMIDLPYVIISLQVLHGLTFGIFYLTGFQLVTKLLPKGLYTTGHLLYTSFFFGLSGIIGSLFGGTIIEFAGTAKLYFYMGVTAFLGTLMLILYQTKVFDRKRGDTESIASTVQEQ